MHFWRQVKENKKKTKQIEDNGTSGFQVDFLLHTARKKVNTKDYLENDNCMKTNYQIKEKDFLHYYNNLLNVSNCFDDIKPSTKSRTKFGDTEIFENYDQWIYTRIIKHNNNELTENVYFKELTYYKIYTFYGWIRKTKSMFSLPYPRSKIINEVTVNCLYEPMNF